MPQHDVDGCFGMHIAPHTGRHTALMIAGAPRTVLSASLSIQYAGFAVRIPPLAFKRAHLHDRAVTPSLQETERAARNVGS